jgi:hypothetical protein
LASLIAAGNHNCVDAAVPIAWPFGEQLDQVRAHHNVVLIRVSVTRAVGRFVAADGVIFACCVQMVPLLFSPA